MHPLCTRVRIQRRNGRRCDWIGNRRRHGRLAEMNKLTAREVQVLLLIARGCTYNKAACKLSISSHTVAAHIKNIYRKLGVHTAAEAVMRAAEMQLLGSPPSRPW